MRPELMNHPLHRTGQRRRVPGLTRRARGWLIAPLALIALMFALPAAAQDDWDEDDEDQSGGAMEAVNEYGDEIGNRLLIGVNGWLTSPADPILGLVMPREEFDGLPGAVVTKYPVGLIQGCLLMGYRVVMAFGDVTLFWVTPLKMLSPAPRFMLFPGVEHTEY